MLPYILVHTVVRERTNRDFPQFETVFPNANNPWWIVNASFLTLYSTYTSLRLDYTEVVCLSRYEETDDQTEKTKNGAENFDNENLDKTKVSC